MKIRLVAKFWYQFTSPKTRRGKTHLLPCYIRAWKKREGGEPKAMIFELLFYMALFFTGRYTPNS